MADESVPALGIGAARRTRIVGVVASAGGLEPMEQFLSSAPAASGLAYVVVQHMDPAQEALLRELLQRATAMPVREVAQTLRQEMRASQEELQAANEELQPANEELQTIWRPRRAASRTC